MIVRGKQGKKSSQPVSPGKAAVEGVVKTAPVPPASRASRAARQATIEKSRARYLELACGCYCPVEVYQLYSVFNESGYTTEAFCEKHNEFKSVMHIHRDHEWTQHELPF